MLQLLYRETHLKPLSICQNSVTEHVVDLAHLELQKAFEKSSYQKILKTELDKMKEENPLKV